MKVVLGAAEKTSFPKEKILLFADKLCRPTEGLQDWSTMLASAEDAENWKWRSLSEEDAKSTVAILNYSSG